MPRGYAFVAPDMAGTGRSTGCADQGGRSDIESIKVVIEWLNGNAVARNAAGEVVEATWSNGRTGMIGKSYDGTLANGVAATGVEAVGAAANGGTALPPRILNMTAPQVGHLPFTAFRPFFICSSTASPMGRFALHFTQ